MMPDGDWTEVENPVAMTLVPHFYQTRWFYAACLVTAGLAVWLAFRLRTLRIRAQWNTVLAERSRIARELHDTLIQGFSGVTMQMQALAGRLPANSERQTLEEIIRDAGVSLADARRSVGGLRDSASRDAGLVPALAQAARQLTDATNLTPRLKLPPLPAPLPVDVEYNLLRIAQEAMTNAVKHSGATTLDVSLESQPERLLLTVRDDGSGFTVPPGEKMPPGHYGLIGMRERAAQIHATLQIDSGPGRGTTVHLELPFPATASKTAPTQSEASRTPSSREATP